MSRTYSAWLIWRASSVCSAARPGSGRRPDPGRAAEQTELARQISQALYVRDMPRAQQLIEDGADLFGHSSMVAAVAAQARQDEWAAMDALSFGITGRAGILTPAPAMGGNGGLAGEPGTC